VAEVLKRMPIGADIMFISAETYVPYSMKYLGLAVPATRIQGQIVHSRGYSNAMYQDLNPVLFWVKEIKYQGFGQFFGEESWRGGRQRGDFRTTIDMIAAKKVDAEGHVTRIVPFEDIKTDNDFRDILLSLPEKEAKILRELAENRVAQNLYTLQETTGIGRKTLAKRIPDMVRLGWVTAKPRAGVSITDEGRRVLDI
jgi:hypothetical protein